ncbi:2-oxo acid dehydrogenase subunit E2 [Candidatus Aenigmatarchaeota archaeon]
MVHEIIVPRISSNTDAAVITKWLKKEGDRVAKGDPIFEILTEKATVLVESEFDGILHKALYKENSTVYVAKCVGLIADKDEDVSKIDLKKYTYEEKIQKNKILTTPAAKKIIEEKGLDIEAIAKQKKSGIIREKDVMAFLNTKPTSYKDMEIEAIKDNFVNIIPSSVSIRVNTTTLKEKIKNIEKNKGVRTTIGEVVLYSMSRTIKDHSIFNSFYSDNKIKKYDKVNIGLVVGIDDTIFVPVIRESDKKSIEEISKEVKQLVMKSIKKTLGIDDIKDCTITLTDMSSSDVIDFSPLINKNQSCIIGISSEYSVGEKSYMNLINVFDHRVANGMTAANFLTSIKKNIENLD